MQQGSGSTGMVLIFSHLPKNGGGVVHAVLFIIYRNDICPPCPNPTQTAQMEHWTR